MRFNGISDAVIIPMQNFAQASGNFQSGAPVTDMLIPTALDSFTFESWVIPDSGGIVWEYEHVMRLAVGAPSSSAPASFQVKLRSKDTGNENTFTLSSATAITKPDGTVSHYDGVTYPRTALVVHDAYDALDGLKPHNAAVHDGHRELLQVSVMFNKRHLSLRINGDIVAAKTLTSDHELVMYPTQVFVGGQGGEFRGTIEAIHWARGAHDSSVDSYAPVLTDSTLGLWRFEEPIEPISTILALPSLSASTSANSTITIGATEAQSLIDVLTGKSGITSIDLTSATYSAGNYTVTKNAANSESTITIPQVSFNLLINPLGYNRTTGVPNREAPERVRLTNVDASAGTITVESIHLDFVSNTTNGRRGLLMAHSASDAVIVIGDCLVDSGTANQGVGTGTQFSNRQGQVAVDESDFENHGIVFSTRMAIADDPYMKYSATTNMGAAFTAGHTGRHILNHVKSHPYIGMLPRPIDSEVEQNIDGSASVMTATFAPQYANVRDAAPANSIVSFYDVSGPFTVASTSFTTEVKQVVENGMAGITDSNRDLLALGVEDVRNFLLRSATSTSLTSLTTDSDEHIRHMTPSSESRTAMLEIPSLLQYGRPALVQVKYNAVDITGRGIKHAATARLTAGISGGGTVLTFASVKQFGANTDTITADLISIGGEVAGASSITATISHSANTLTFSSATTGAFQSAATTNAIVNSYLSHGALLVESTYPDVGEEVTSGTRIIDLIHTDIKAGNAVVHAAGGVLRCVTTSQMLYKEGELNGDDEEGHQTERVLDFTMCPENYLPVHTSDSPQLNPRRILSPRASNSARDSVFNRIVIIPSSNGNDKFDVDLDGHLVQGKQGTVRKSTGVFVNNNGGHAAGTTTITVDGANATNFFGAGTRLFSLDGVQLGTVGSSTSTSITLASGSTQAVVDNEELFYQPMGKAVGTTAQSSGVHEVFDIVSHTTDGIYTEFVVQPSDRNRFTQLSKLFTNEQGTNVRANQFEIHYLMGRGRALTMSDGDAGTSVLRAHGLGADLAANSISVKGDGAPDSFIVKETMPGSPVVTVTLGGAGQGAINTKPTYNPSPTARLGWSTRRDCSVRVSATTSTKVTVVPLNNKSAALASWGTYCFPKVGRIYFGVPVESGDSATKYASAEYTSKDGTQFTFSSGTGHTGSGKFLLTDGSESDSLSAWLTATGMKAGSVIVVDDQFNEGSMCNDGTTINDRLFQTLDTVQHDYQLGTQYASTRAMVEIPLFDDFFFENEDEGIFPGPDNSMKLHLDPTYAAPTWAPNPVGRRAPSIAPEDPTVNSAFSTSIKENKHRRGTVVSQPYDSTNRRIYVQDYKVFPIATAAPVTVASIDGALRYRRAFLPSGEWVLYDTRNTSGYLEVAGNVSSDDNWAFSKNFLQQLSVGVSIMPASGFQDMNYPSIADNPLVDSAGFEARRPYYYDRANVMTQGGNVDYGMKQYVSAVEFRAGPRANPHLKRIKNKRARSTSNQAYVLSTLVLADISDFPKSNAHASNYKYRIAWWNGTVYKFAHYDTINTTTGAMVLNNIDSGFTPQIGDEIILWDMHAPSGVYPEVKEDAFLNTAWANPYCNGGLRAGDTVWMNMHYTNPHAIEGLFCKSRGTLNEAEVWSGFLEGEGDFATTPRESIAMENFLIGNSCIETARNFVQHVNKTIELNYEALGLDAANAPTVAYIDPYQSTEEHARVLLYDVAHDREFIAFQDLWMQVQSSPQAATIGAEPQSTGTINNQTTGAGTGLDVANGFPSQNKSLASTTQSEFMEAAMAHKSTWNLNVDLSTHATGYHGHTPSDPDLVGIQVRTNPAVSSTKDDLANDEHQQINVSTTENSTFFDTPDGTRCIPVFLALKGIRTTSLDLSTHEESRLQHLPHWSDMDFVRRLTIDFGEIGMKDGIRNIEAAAREIVRLINQAGAPNGRTHARKPADQYFGESERFGLSRVANQADVTNGITDPTAAHLNAGFAATGSTHDPSPFWDKERAFASHDRGTHMGYMRAHLGRVVSDSGGKSGFSIIIHSTIPGASGRNFCVWLDNARGQLSYRPQFLIGHGGRFRNYWCQPDEMTGENMHPAPMPINRFGRPFAPVTTLKEYLPPDEVDEPFRNNLEFGPETTGTSSNMASSTSEIASGRNSNTIIDESFEAKSPASQLIDGLRIGTHARARINFGGLTQAGIPGWAPDAGNWGFGRDQQDTRFEHIYGNNVAAFAQHGTVDATSTGGYIPDEQLRTDSIGDGQLYGIRFIDHRGKNHTIRMVYRQHSQSFANDLTVLPSTLDDEVVIHFDDRDVGQGGFTIGKHMFGEGDVCGEFTAGTKKKFKGNLWNNYPSPATGISATVQVVTVSGADALKITFTAPYDTSSTLNHPDILGYLGFPEKGMIQLNDVNSSGVAGNNGEPLYYQSRSYHGKAGASGVHYLYNVEGNTSAYGSGETRIICPRMSFTSVLTDEVMAAAVEFALTMDDPNSADVNKTTFDCTHMLAPDGRTLGEWGVSPTAIRVKSHSASKRIIPLRKLFEVSREKDWGFQAGASVQATGTDHLGGLSTDEFDDGTRLDVGYIPKTVLHITTKYRGTNANTATPVLVDSANNVVDTIDWKQNLRGNTFYRTAGDRVIPCVNSPMINVHNTSSTGITLPTSQYLYLITTPASTDTDSWAEKITVWLGSEESGIVSSKPGSTSTTELEFVADSAQWSGTIANSDILVRQGSIEYSSEVGGIRRAGSHHGEPFLHFRGAHDSPDHWVPLYFGGGFSGVTLDVNDGTQNDYSEFYEHPYSGGPTGSAGLQNVGEIAGSYALLDANAMLAMFPGTPYLDQHEGRNSMPFFNQDAMLSFDLDAGNSTNSSSTGVTYTGGGTTVRCQRPSPIVLRFSHPHARYTAAGDATDHTTYMIFGPGQSVPHNFAAHEPQLSSIVTGGNGYSAVPTGKNLPNEIAHGAASRNGFSAHLPPTAEYQKGNVQGYNYVMNWEPSKGQPNSTLFAQTAGQGLFYDTQMTATNPPAHAHPMSYVFTNYAGVAMGASGLATTLARSCVWHMDGGYHPGGHFLDNHIERNPKHPVSTLRISTGSNAQQNPTVFRVSSLLGTAYLSTFGGDTNMTSNADYVVIDATRAQNAEELATIVSAGVNTFPGTDPLKAIGGTFLPSFQTAAKQDRYGWVELTMATGGYTAESGAAATLQANASIPTTLPQYGWLRITDGGSNVGFASYASYSSATFTLAKNLTTTTNIVDPTTKAAVTASTINGLGAGAVKIYVWTKAGTHRYNNTSEARDHMTQVHYSGYADAVDRTKPIGAVGWSGEAYSYLNSYNGTQIGSTKFPAGKGAWHPFLGFNPYGAAESCLSGSSPIGADSMPASVYEQSCEIGLASRHLIAITHESEMPLIAKADRDGILCAGDWLDLKRGGNITHAGTTQWDTAKVHNRDRYVGPATAGPHVEAMMLADVSSYPQTASYPAVGTETYWHSRVTSAAHIERADPCQSPTGDLFWDESKVTASQFHEDTATYGVTCQGITSPTQYSATGTGIYKFYKTQNPARNFNEEHVVWKRMDGGNLTMPASNARGLGMVPWVYRKDGGAYKKVGEKILGNNRFSFETTNGAMFPIIQAQELSHPQLAEQNQFATKIEDALLIPNEEIQFQSLQVVDDTGQEHRIAGGSPLGTVILDFRHLSNREIEGLSPALAGSGISPNLKIRLPDPDDIPGNIIIRPSFDRIQGYQNETMGSGGMQHPSQPQQAITNMFNNAQPGPRAWPTWENNGWEHLSQDGTDISTTKSKTRLGSPDSSVEGWSDHTNNNPLETAYEPHDRSLQFHVTRMGITMTHRDDVDELTFSNYDDVDNEIDVSTTPEPSTWLNASERSGGRWFLRVYDPTTNKGVLASYTGTDTDRFIGVVVSPDFISFVTGKIGLKVVPSYFMPAGSTRFFASRRLRDHSEYSGSSPDMPNIDWSSITTTPYTQLTAPKMTPMPIPRMGHHYVTPTMALLPGHYAHPAYQRMYDLHLACRSASNKPFEDAYLGDTEVVANTPGRDPLVWFSGPTAAFAPSDIHGGAFTLMTETKVKYDGYGIAASNGTAGTTNSQGGHSIVLEAAGTYTLDNHFPDPMEVGAYQIIIQPNVFSQQITGYHLNHSDATKAPSESGDKVIELTGQQVNTVIAIEHDTSGLGGITLVLAEATMADVRGCEIIINEVILDLEPDAGSQFTNIPTLGLYNPLGVDETASPAFTRRSLPYRPNMFIQTTPGMTTTVPWWAQLHKDGARNSAADEFKFLEWHTPDHYYQLNRPAFGSVGAQITLAGFSTIYPDIYGEHYRARSLNPSCVVISSDASAQTITVDSNELFPVEPYYGEVLEYIDAGGERRTATYTNRTGTLAHATLAAATTFEGVSTANLFFTNLTAGTILRLSGPYDNRKAGEVFKNSESSIATRTLAQTFAGTRDTNSLHTPDAFLCMWHPNLGRPYTYYSDDSSRSFYSAAGAADSPVNKASLNNIPEHFETIHYHDFFYAASKGPFALGMSWVAPPHDADNDAATTDFHDGSIYTGAQMDALVDGTGTLDHQGGTDGSDKYNFAGYWPSGSRGGAGSSRLDGFLEAVIGWGGKLFGIDCVGFRDDSGIEERTYAQMTSDSDYARNTCFGYRFSVRQPYNRPRWSPYVRGWIEGTQTNALLGYYHGPFVQQDNKTSGWDYVGADTYHASSNPDGQSDADFPATYTGILERLTQISAMLNQDQIGRQVRYSDGRRMTQPFGCPVRTVRNASTVRRMYPNDHAGLGIAELAQAHRFYLIDWWGNTRGEDVRRFPVRGFGIRPAWDPEDAYADTNVTHRPAANSLFGGDGTDRYSGNANNDNNASSNMGTADWFNPASAMRVGDRGDGRGVRWPTHFNESLLADVSETVEPTGLVVSQPTAEPTVGKGLIRPRNDVLQTDEVERGISNRLGLADEDGLLKPTAMVSEGVESVTANSLLAEPVGGDGVRAGLDVDTLGELNDGISREYVIMSTEAHSLHTDREVGQRTTLRGALDIGSQTLGHLNMTSLSWSGQPVKGVLRVSNAHAFWALGGTYVMDWSVREGVLSDFGWGATAAADSTNPYQDANHSPKVDRTNNTDSTIEFLLRPVMTLDKSHIQMFRHNPVVTGSTPQASPNFYAATGGCKYGFYVSDAPSARTGTPSSPPYKPVYAIKPASSVTTSTSDGPKILGVDVTGYTKTDVTQPVARIVMSENTLEHFRSDAPRRLAEDGESDFSVQPRHSQTLHPKGSSGDTSFNTGDHSGE